MRLLFRCRQKIIIFLPKKNNLSLKDIAPTVSFFLCCRFFYQFNSDNGRVKVRENIGGTKNDA